MRPRNSSVLGDRAPLYAARASVPRGAMTPVSSRPAAPGSPFDCTRDAGNTPPSSLWPEITLAIDQRSAYTVSLELRRTLFGDISLPQGKSRCDRSSTLLFHHSATPSPLRAGASAVWARE